MARIREKLGLVGDEWKLEGEGAREGRGVMGQMRGEGETRRGDGEGGEGEERVWGGGDISQASPSPSPDALR